MSETLPYQQLENRIIQIIISSPDVNQMLMDIAKELGQSFSVDVCFITHEINEQSKHNLAFWSINNNFNSQNIAHIPVQEILDFGLFAISNISESPFKNTCKNSNLSALLISKTSGYNQLNSAIILGEYQAYNWTENEISSLKNISVLVSLALRVCQLQQEAKLSNQYETLLREIGGTLLQTSSLNSLFILALESTLKTLQINQGLILTLKYNNPLFKRLGKEAKPQGKADIICQSEKFKNNKKYQKNQSFNIAESDLILKALEKAPETLAIENVNNYPDLIINNPEIIFDSQTTESLLFVPIMGSMTSEARTPIILGFLILQDQKSHVWSNHELQLVNWVSIQISINMLHNQSLSRVQSLVEERTSQLKWSLDVQAKLSEKMRQQLEELQQLNKLKDDFLSSMSHELNTPLTTMKIAIKMLRQPYCDAEKQTKYLDILEQEWNREYNLIKDLLTLQQVESQKLSIQLKQVNLKDIIDKLGMEFNKKWSENKGLNLVVNYDLLVNKKQSLVDNLQLYTDPYTLEQIIGELLLNAGKYADPETKVELNIERKITREGYLIIITITNYGWGISPDEQRYIFDKFRRGKGVTDSAIPGTGLGLTMVKSLVDHLEGNIEVSSFPLENSPSFVTSFTVTLPQSFQ